MSRTQGTSKTIVELFPLVFCKLLIENNFITSFSDLELWCESLGKKNLNNDVMKKTASEVFSVLSGEKKIIEMSSRGDFLTPMKESRKLTARWIYEGMPSHAF